MCAPNNPNGAFTEILDPSGPSTAVGPAIVTAGEVIFATVVPIMDTAGAVEIILVSAVFRCVSVVASPKLIASPPNWVTATPAILAVVPALISIEPSELVVSDISFVAVITVEPN